jgi:Domain of unknown function (DUF1905)
MSDPKLFLVEGKFVLQKMPGKGGWTYALLPTVAPDPHAHFGWIRVNGFIDNFPIVKLHLMPNGQGKLFLSVKADIRKRIKKEVGDIVHVLLYRDTNPDGTPIELLDCLRDAGKIEFFNNLDEKIKQAHIDHIFAARTDDLKSDRIISLIEGLQ